MNKGAFGLPRGGGGFSRYSGASVTASAAQSMASGSGQNVLFDVEEWDTDNYHQSEPSLGASGLFVGSSGLVVPAAGWYEVKLWLPWASNSTARRTFASIYIASVNGAFRLCARHEYAASTTATEVNHFCACEERAQPGDAFFAQGFQNSGSPINTGFGSGGTDVRARFQIRRIG